MAEIERHSILLSDQMDDDITMGFTISMRHSRG